MTGETSAETTAAERGGTGNGPTEERDSTPPADAPAAHDDGAQANGSGPEQAGETAATTADQVHAERDPGAGGERPQAAEGERPQAAEGERPQAAEGERPQAAEGERPQVAEGERPQVAEGEQPQPGDDGGQYAPAVEAGSARQGDVAAATQKPEPEQDQAAAPDGDRPPVGPKILGVAADPKPLPHVKASLTTRKRRRRPSAAERHRRAFFAALTELRRGSQPSAPAADRAGADGEAAAGGDAPAAGAPDAGALPAEIPAPVEAPAPAEAPASAEAPAAAEAPASAEAPAPAEGPASAPQDGPAADGSPTPPAAQNGPAADRSPTSPARVTAAIERVGGVEVIKEALKPKQDEKGQPLKWAAVCAQAAEGRKPGDPVFNAWVRLAATPVREVKAQLPRPPAAERSRGEGGRRSGGQRGAGRGRRDDRPSRAEYASHAQDGTLRKSIRIVTGHDEDLERRERERIRKEQREAKRRAERERLARLGY